MNTDLILDEDNEPIIEDGDFVIDISDDQHIQMIMELQKGELKQYPEIGVGMVKNINGRLNGKYRKEIRLQLDANGYENAVVTINGDEITIHVPQT